MKKFTKIALTIVLAGIALIGCGGGSSSNNEPSSQPNEQTTETSTSKSPDIFWAIDYDVPSINCKVIEKAVGSAISVEEYKNNMQDALAGKSYPRN